MQNTCRFTFLQKMASLEWKTIAVLMLQYFLQWTDTAGMYMSNVNRVGLKMCLAKCASIRWCNYVRFDEKQLNCEFLEKGESGKADVYALPADILRSGKDICPKTATILTKRNKQTTCVKEYCERADMDSGRLVPTGTTIHVKTSNIFINCARTCKANGEWSECYYPIDETDRCLKSQKINNTGVHVKLITDSVTFSSMAKVCEKNSGRLAVLNCMKLWNVTSTLLQNDGYVDVARGKPTTQSSTYHLNMQTSHSKLAVDGNYVTDWYQGCSATHDDNTTINWWQVDLTHITMVQRVDILPRSDRGSDFKDVRNFLINVYMEDPGSNVLKDDHNCADYRGRELTPGIWSQVLCGSPVLGRYVRIVKLPGFFGLTLCEVKVLASGGPYYVGATDVNPDGVWRWSDQSDVTGPWIPGQPENAMAHCLGVTKCGYVPISCNKTFPGICEYTITIG